MHCTKKLFCLGLAIFTILAIQTIFVPTKNFANSNGPEIIVEQLLQDRMYSPSPYSTVGMVTLFYTPELYSYFVNIVAIDWFEQPQWIVRNLYIPDNSWIARMQSISARFCLWSLGFNDGDTVRSLDMAVISSETVLAEMPQSGEFSTVGVDTLRDDAEGIDSEIPPTEPFVGDHPRFPEFDPTDQIVPVEFRGCRVPNIDLDDSTYPDTEEYAGDRNACGPASAANSLEWLDSTYAEIDIPGSLRATLWELSKLMNRARNGGVSIENFIRGKLDFIEAHNLQINVKFQSSFLPGDVISSSGMTFARNDNDGNYPTWDWLKEQMADSEDVEMMYYWQDGESWRGHAVVVTGVEESKDSTKKTVKFKHDVCQTRAGGTKQEDESIYVDRFNRMILRSRNAFIGNAVAESPGEPYPTPVELGLFTAEVVKNDVLLFWKTESESNNYGFEILRNNERIAFVKGHGTTSEPQAYFYKDPRLNGGSYFYDLIQIDFDGTREEIGGTSIVVSNNPSEFALSQNYPNPFNALTKIKYTVPERSFISIKIYTVLGEEIARLVDEEKEAGTYTIDFDADHLLNGIYFYRMEVAGFSQIRKLLLLK